jgi:long-chain acyl-CoA synthetase
MRYKIVAPGSCDTLPAGETGEICISGPTVMHGYDNDEAETALAVRTHSDGRLWLHTGDLGYMDGEGFVYFKGRIKRLIITSGYSVYPAQVEAAVDSHPAVKESCAVGVPDAYKMSKIKAYVVLNAGFNPGAELREELLRHTAKSVAKYALPYTFEFIDALPRTLIGKVDYRKLGNCSVSEGVLPKLRVPYEQG